MRKDGLIATDVTWGHKGRREIRAKKNNTHTHTKKKRKTQWQYTSLLALSPNTHLHMCTHTHTHTVTQTIITKHLSTQLTPLSSGQIRPITL